MNAITIVILICIVVGALDKLFGDRFGVGKEFEKGFSLFMPMAMSMLGMLVVAPAIGEWLEPMFEWFYGVFGIDPSIIPASLFANDMGGFTLSQTVAQSTDIGNYNAFVVSSMMGCTISYTIPFSLGAVKKEQHKEMLFGILCGIVAVPFGCVAGGLVCGIGIGRLLFNMLPLIIFAVVLGVLLVLFTNVCIKVFAVLGNIIRAVSMIGLVCAIFTFLTDIQICEHFATFEYAAGICTNACITLAGALPFMFIVSKLLDKPLSKAGSKMGINAISAVSLLSSTVSSTPVFGLMDKMNKKGVVLNAAFAVSAAFTFGGHMAFTMAYDKSYVVPMIVGKLVSGVFALVLALLLYKEDKSEAKQSDEVSA